MVKRKLDGAVNKSSADQEIRRCDTTIYITWEKSGGLHLVDQGLMAGWLADEIWVRLEILKACCGSKYSIFCFV